MKIIIVIATLVLVALLAKNIMVLIFSMENHNIHKKRLKQLQKNNKKDEMELSNLVDAITKPVIKIVFSKFRPRKLDELQQELSMSKWSKYMTPVQYRALDFVFKVLGIGLAIIFWKESAFLAIIWGVVLFFALGFLMKNEKGNRKGRLLADFPDFIRITQGYLSANLPFAQAVAESIRYVGDEWKPVLQQFAVDIEVHGVDEALDRLKKEIDLFEVREFVSIVRLTLEQGGNVNDSFNAQATKVRQMQLDNIAIKIGQRQTMGIIIQGPLLLAALTIFGLPTVGAVMNL